MPFFEIKINRYTILSLGKHHTLKITFKIILNVFSNVMQFVKLFFITDLLIIFLFVQGFWIFEFASYLPIWGGILFFILLISILRGSFLLIFFIVTSFFECIGWENMLKMKVLFSTQLVSLTTLQHLIVIQQLQYD